MIPFGILIANPDLKSHSISYDQRILKPRKLPWRLLQGRQEDHSKVKKSGDLINATTVALLVLSLMVMTRIVEWDDVLAHKQAWNVLVWFATLVTMADGLNKVGFLKWFAGGAAGALNGYAVMTIVMALTVVYFVVHYMFASLTAHTTALLPVLLTAAIAVPEMPVKLIALLFCYTLGLMGIISPYATGPGPIYYGSGYMSRKEFWTLGLIFGAIYLAVLLVMLASPICDSTWDERSE